MARACGCLGALWGWALGRECWRTDDGMGLGVWWEDGSMAMQVTPVRFSGERGGLVPLELGHVAGLRAALEEGELWKLWVAQLPGPEDLGAEVERRLALWREGSMLPFTVLDRAGRCVGMTSYMNIEPEHWRLEIGSTWLAKSVQRTGLNRECKQFLLTHAFERLECVAVELRTHRLNGVSRRAIEGLGAQLDGVLRAHRRMRDGSLRDTAVYSITAADWPAVKAHLAHGLARDA